MAREGCALHGVHRNLNWSCRAVTAEVPVAQLEVAGPVVIDDWPGPGYGGQVHHFRPTRESDATAPDRHLGARGG